MSATFSRDGAPSGKKVSVDRELAREYYEQLANIKEHLSLSEPIDLDAVIALPGVVNVEEPKEDIDEMWSNMRSALVMSVDQLIETREAEGAAILEDLSGRLEIMSQLVERISTQSPEVAESYRQRLQKRIGDLLDGQTVIDESRLAVEVAILAERSDITEEIVRLRSHIEQIKAALKQSDEPVGRRLDFILQEVNREVNTIASKASDTKISVDCIQFKDETEKMREQAQNIE